MRTVTATSIAAVLSGALIAASATAVFAAGFDGDWTVNVITVRGGCDRNTTYDVHVANGRIEYRTYNAISMYGTVSPQGAVNVSIRRFDDGAQGTGHLDGQSGHGHGGWSGAGKSGSCSGRWEAHRR